MKNDLGKNEQQGSIVGEPTKGFEIKGTFLDKDIKQESLAEAIIKAFDDAEKVMEEFAGMINNVFINIGKSELLRALVSKTNYFCKYKTSNWITKWYWKRKYEKACKECEFWEKYISQLNNGDDGN